MSIRSLALFALAAATGSTGCATLKALNSGGVTNEQLTERNKALDAAIANLSACSAKSQPTDTGLLAVTAAPDGKVSVDGVQWFGTEEAKQCLVAEAAKVTLPAWSGPPVSDVWSIGTKDNPAPAMVEALPLPMQTRLAAYMAQADDVETGPIVGCAQRNLPNEAYAVVRYRVFVFADGKVAGATPWAVKGEGRDVGFINCAHEFVKEWQFEGFADKGFTMTEVNIRRGVDSSTK